MINKYRNGYLLLKPDASDFDADGQVNESFYHDDMFGQSLYLEQINTMWYIVDFQKSLCYAFGSYLMQNPLKELLEILSEKKYLLRSPLSVEESNKLLATLCLEEDFPDEEL